MKRIILWMAIALAACQSNQNGADTHGENNLEQAFKNPPADTRPGCYWYWINDNISKEGLTRDLEAMARVGIGRAFIGHIFYHEDAAQHTPVGPVKFYSDAWWDAVQWAVKEADRCDVEIGFFNGPGWSQSGGPWLKPHQSMRYNAYSETRLTGGKRIEVDLPVPEITTYPVRGGSRPKRLGPDYTAEDFQDTCVVAFKVPESEVDDEVMDGARIEGVEDAGNMQDGSLETFANLPKGRTTTTLTITLDEDPVAVQSLRIVPLDAKVSLNCRIEASTDGKNFTEIALHNEERGFQGPGGTDPILIPFPATEARYFRIRLEVRKLPRVGENGPFRVAELALSRQAVLAHYVRKQLADTVARIHPPYDGYIWPDQVAAAGGSTIPVGDVIDLSDQMDDSGKLSWDAPAGEWSILRMGMIPIGTHSVPASPEAEGLEVDKMNEAHVRSHFTDGMMGEFIRRTPTADRKALKYVIADSYETGPQNWTDGLHELFEKRYGYSAIPYLPAVTGRVVESPEVSTRFLWDLRRLIVESIAYEYVGGLRKISNEHGLKLWLENYGHWGFPSEALLYGSQADEIGGEFWESQPQPTANNPETRVAASSAHIYGKRDVFVEAFTSVRNFKQSPADLKRWLDWIYSMGVNHLILHVNIHQPDERKPGIIQSFGTAFNRHNTWFEQSKAFIDYLRRCAVLLKAGLPVADVAYYIGEDAPNMDAQRSPEIPDGYDFDYINSDALIRLAQVKEEKIVLPGGPSYSILVLPPRDTMRPEVLAAIGKLVEAGATVIGPPPERSPSLQNYPACDVEVQRLAKKIWSNEDRVFAAESLDVLESKLGVGPDVALVDSGTLKCAVAGTGRVGFRKQGGIVFKHRQEGPKHIYFLSNTTDEAQAFTVSLRVAGLKPELWNAVTGVCRDAEAFSQEKGRTLIPLHLEPSESIFVVLRQPVASTARGTGRTNQATLETITTLEGQWDLRFEGLGAPEPITLDSLVDLSGHADPDIKHFSGTCIYQHRFTLPVGAERKPLILDLGQVGIIATVHLNGREAGTVWTAPWEIDLTGLARPGENELEIHVANTWNNRLAAEEGQPPEKRLSHTSQPYRKEKLQPSGLLGPAHLKTRN